MKCREAMTAREGLVKAEFSMYDGPIETVEYMWVIT